MIRNKTGLWGEIFAVRYMRDIGYKILETNYKCRFGEVDVIALKNEVICVVEVKTRNKNTAVRPGEAVDFYKKSRLEASTRLYMTVKNLHYDEMRFDVCEVLLDDDMKLFSINYIENAF